MAVLILERIRLPMPLINEVLDDLATSKDKLLQTQTTGEIQQVLSEIKTVLNHLDSYSLTREFVTALLTEVLSTPKFLKKIKIQYRYNINDIIFIINVKILFYLKKLC